VLSYEFWFCDLKYFFRFRILARSRMTIESRHILYWAGDSDKISFMKNMHILKIPDDNQILLTFWFVCQKGSTVV
jgi:hypothetical protein